MKVLIWFLELTGYCIIQKPCGKFAFVILKVIRSPRSDIHMYEYLKFSEVVAVDVQWNGVIGFMLCGLVIRREEVNNTVLLCALYVRG
jgi:hypothetical protein